jgi:hypothetical protein
VFVGAAAWIGTVATFGVDAAGAVLRFDLNQDNLQPQPRQLAADDPALESDGCRDSYQREAGMGLGSELEHADRFATYVNELTKVLGHADREKPFRDYCAGLLATEGRRSVLRQPLIFIEQLFVVPNTTQHVECRTVS